MDVFEPVRESREESCVSLPPGFLTSAILLGSAVTDGRPSFSLSRELCRLIFGFGCWRRWREA
jgi:hypothetical protein